MFCGRKTNSRTNPLHDRALRIVYKNRDLSFDHLFKNDGSFMIHHRNIHTLSIELLKVKNDLLGEIINNIFGKRQIVNAT